MKKDTGNRQGKPPWNHRFPPKVVRECQANDVLGAQLDGRDPLIHHELVAVEKWCTMSLLGFGKIDAKCHISHHIHLLYIYIYIIFFYIAYIISFVKDSLRLPLRLPAWAQTCLHALFAKVDVSANICRLVLNEAAPDRGVSLALY